MSDSNDANAASVGHASLRTPTASWARRAACGVLAIAFSLQVRPKQPNAGRRVSPLEVPKQPDPSAHKTPYTVLVNSTKIMPSVSESSTAATAAAIKPAQTPLLPRVCVRIPPPLKALQSRLAASLERHRSCSYAQLLRKHTRSDLLCFAVKNSLGEKTDTAVLHSLLSLATPRAAVAAFVSAALDEVFGVAFWGSHRAAAAAQGRLVWAALRGRFESVTATDLVAGIPIQDVSWLSAAQRARVHGACKAVARGDARKMVSAGCIRPDAGKNAPKKGNEKWSGLARASQQILCLLQTFLLREVVIPLLRQHFYVADSDSATTGSAVVFLHRTVWLAVLRRVVEPSPFPRLQPGASMSDLGSNEPDPSDTQLDLRVSTEPVLAGTVRMYEQLTPMAAFALLSCRAPGLRRSVALVHQVNAGALSVAQLHALGRRLVATDLLADPVVGAAGGPRVVPDKGVCGCGNGCAGARVCTAVCNDEGIPGIGIANLALRVCKCFIENVKHLPNYWLGCLTY